MPRPNAEPIIAKAKSLMLAPFHLDGVSVEDAIFSICLASQLLDESWNGITLPGVQIILSDTWTEVKAVVWLHWTEPVSLMEVVTALCEQADLEALWFGTGLILVPKIPVADGWVQPEPEDLLPPPPEEMGRN